MNHLASMGVSSRECGTLGLCVALFGMGAFKEKREGVERQTERHNDTNTTAENICEDLKVMIP